MDADCSEAEGIAPDAGQIDTPRKPDTAGNNNAREEMLAPASSSVCRLNVMRRLAPLLIFLLVIELFSLYTYQLFIDRLAVANANLEQIQTLNTTEQLVQMQLNGLFDTALPRAPFEEHHVCLQRALTTAYKQMHGAGSVYVDVRAQVVSWAEDNCSRLLHSPATLSPTLRESILSHWAYMTAKTRRVFTNALQSSKNLGSRVAQKTQVLSRELTRKYAKVATKAKGRKESTDAEEAPDSARVYNRCFTKTQLRPSDCIHRGLQTKGAALPEEVIVEFYKVMEEKASATSSKKSETIWPLRLIRDYFTTLKKSRAQKQAMRVFKRVLSSSPKECEQWFARHAGDSALQHIAGKLQQLQQVQQVAEQQKQNTCPPRGYASSFPNLIVRCHSQQPCHIIDVQPVGQLLTDSSLTIEIVHAAKQEVSSLERKLKFFTRYIAVLALLAGVNVVALLLVDVFDFCMDLWEEGMDAYHLIGLNTLLELPVVVAFIIAEYVIVTRILYDWLHRNLTRDDHVQSNAAVLLSVLVSFMLGLLFNDFPECYMARRLYGAFEDYLAAGQPHHAEDVTEEQRLTDEAPNPDGQSAEAAHEDEQQRRCRERSEEASAEFIEDLQAVVNARRRETGTSAYSDTIHFFDSDAENDGSETLSLESASSQSPGNNSDWSQVDGDEEDE